MDEGGSKAEEAAKELAALITARDVLQKQIDERVALRRQEMLLANIKGKVDDWRC